MQSTVNKLEKKSRVIEGLHIEYKLRKNAFWMKNFFGGRRCWAGKRGC
jgi:hypothetical protein